ncbi:MAG: sulfur oxidation c-type cytochrome SoxA [Alphaproteobacteria bacterium]|nr:sulfur oxidation c-type cytochrome SoxA [Alphaproteobacteria bacterium]
MHKSVAGLIPKRALLAAIAVVTVASTSVLAVDHTKLDGRMSGYQYLTPEIQALQDDDSLNPGMTVLALGEELWNKVEGAAEKSCGDCHFDAEDRMWKIAARYPKYLENIPGFGEIVGLEEQINWMRERKMEAEPYAYESDEMLALATYVAYQSRLLPVEVDTRGISQWFYNHGQELYEEQRGKLSLSCADCHEDQKGNAWLEDRLSEGQSNGFPSYRLRWESLASVQRQIRWCNELVQAEPLEFGSEDMLDLTFFVRWRGRGLFVESPAVRP